MEKTNYVNDTNSLTNFRRSYSNTSSLNTPLLHARRHIMNGQSEDVVSYEPRALGGLQHEGLGEAVRGVLVSLKTNLQHFQ